MSSRPASTRGFSRPDSVTDASLGGVLDALGRLEIPYMLTGSYASNVYGRIRSTLDADLVVLLAPKKMLQLAASLEAEFYLDSRTLAEVREAGNEFNAVHKKSGLRVDFFLRGTAPYDLEAFGRRQTQRIFGRKIPVIAPEDLILAKLCWAKQGGSARQIEDAAGVYLMQLDRLDRTYLTRWATVLSVADLLERIASAR